MLAPCPCSIDATQKVPVASGLKADHSVDGRMSKDLTCISTGQAICDRPPKLAEGNMLKEQALPSEHSNSAKKITNQQMYQVQPW